MADGRIIIDTELNTAEFEGGLKQLDALTVAAGTAIGNMLSAGIGKVKDFVGSAIQSGMEYDTAMSQVAATMGTTVDQITGLAQAASEMGATTKFTATEAAEGINILAMAGLKENDILAENAKGATILSTTLSLASAGAMDMASSAGYLTGAVKGFGDEASNAQYYADLMAKGATLANTDVSGLGSALSDAAATASAYGQKADSVTLSLLRLAEQNVTGSAASTALAAAMKNLYTPTAQAKKALDELGVSAYTTDGKARDFNDVVDELSGALSGYTDEEANAYKQTIFGIQGLDAYNKMSITTADKITEFKEGLAGASEEFGGMGAAAGQSKTQLNNLEGDLTLLSSALDGLSRGIYSTFSDGLRDVVKFGTGAITELTQALETDGIGGMLRVAGEMALSLVQGFAAQLPSLLQTGVDAAVSIIEGLSSGLAGNVTAFINQALPMLMEFSGQLRANAGQLVDAGLGLIMELAQGIADGLPTLIETIPTIIINIAGIINDNAPKLLVTGIKIIGTLATGLIEAIPTLIANIPKIIQAIVAVFTAMNWVNLGSKIIQFIGNGISAVATALPDALKGIGETAVGFVKGINWATLGADIIAAIQLGIESLVSAIPNALQAIGSEAVSLFQSIDWLSLGTNLVAGIAAGVTGALDGAVSAITDLGGAILDGFKDLFGIHSPSTVMGDQGEYIVQGLTNALQSMPNALTGTLSKALSAVTKWGTNLAKNALNAAKTMLTNVVSQVTQLPGKVGTQLTNVIKKVTSWASTMVSKAKTAATQTLSNVVSRISQMPGKVGTQLSSVISKVSSWATSMVSKAKAAASKALSNVVSHISQMPEKVGSQLSSVISKVSSWASSFTSKVKTAASNAVKGLVSQISQLPGKVGTQFSKVISKAASFGSSIKSKFTSIGKNAINGVISGIKDSVSKLYSSIKSALSGLVDKAKSALGIHSPSTVMRDEVGKWIPAGVASGITDNMKVVMKATDSMTKGVATSLSAAKGSAAGEKFASGIIDGIKKSKKYGKESAAAIGDAIVSAADKKLKNYQTINNTTLAYETSFWKKIVKSCKKGTQAYYDAYANYKSALKSYNDASMEAKNNLISLETDYAKNITGVQTNLVKEMNDLWDAYYKSVDDRTKELYNAMGGLFDSFSSTTGNTTQTLLSNMKSQVDGLQSWQADIADLEARGLNADLLSELRELGPKSAADINLLTKMSDAELEKYVNLWQQKMKLCKSQATAENEDLYQSTVSQVKQIQKDAAVEMQQYTRTFVSEVKSLTKQTTAELGALPKSFKNVGKQAIAGITQAIKDDGNDLNVEVKALMLNAVEAAKKSLKIHSPSKVFEDEVGAMIPKGAAGGVRKHSDVLMDALSDMFDDVEDIDTPEIPIEFRLPDRLDFSRFVSLLTSAVRTEIATRTTVVDADSRSNRVLPIDLDGLIDYRKLAGAVIDGFVESNIGVKLYEREVGRLVKT